MTGRYCSLCGEPVAGHTIDYARRHRLLVTGVGRVNHISQKFQLATEGARVCPVVRRRDSWVPARWEAA